MLMLLVDVFAAVGVDTPPKEIGVLVVVVIHTNHTQYNVLYICIVVL